MKKRLFNFIIVCIQIIIVLTSFVCVWKKEAVEYHINPQACIFDAGTVLDEGIFINENDTNTLSGIYTLPIGLSKGSYQVTFYYEAMDSHCVYSFMENGQPHYGIEYDKDISFNENETVQTAHMKIAMDTESFQVKILYEGQGSFLLKQIDIESVKSADYFEVLHLALFFVLFNISALIVYKRGLDKNKGVIHKSIIVPVCIIGILASLPLFSDYMIQGHDLSFHLLRIEGIKDALLSGQFPVRVHPTHFESYGYGTGLYYPEIFLYFPACLRLLGFSVMDAYKIFLFAQNIVTAGIAYFSFYNMCNNKNAGILGSAVYTLSLYRLNNLYYRSAVGESLAMIFVPLVMLGIYCILLSEAKERRIRWQGICVLSVGLTGIIQSHILSCEMIGIVCVILAIVYFKKIFSQQRWLDLCISSSFVLLMNVWFLVPFLQAMREDILVKYEGGDIAGQALNPVQLFFPFAELKGHNQNLLNGIYAEMPFGIGIVITIGIILIILQLGDWYKNDRKQRHGFGVVCFVLGIVCLWMTTTWFPWIQINEIGGLIAKVMNMVQYPWRYIGPATVFLIIAILFYLKDCANEKLRNGIGIAFVFTMVFSTCLYAQQLYQNENVYRIYYEEGVDELSFGATEYLYNGTKVENIIPEDELIDMQEHIVAFDKSGSNMDITIQNNSAEEINCYLPAFYYPCYVAYDIETKEEFIPMRLREGNNIIQLIIPAGYEGNIRIEVKDSLLWKCMNVISLITFATFLWIGYKNILKNKKE